MSCWATVTDEGEIDRSKYETVTLVNGTVVRFLAD